VNKKVANAWSKNLGQGTPASGEGKLKKTEECLVGTAKFQGHVVCGGGTGNIQRKKEKEGKSTSKKNRRESAVKNGLGNGVEGYGPAHPVDEDRWPRKKVAGGRQQKNFDRRK